MKEANEILNELESVSSALAAIERVNIFRVPEGYFADLPERISTSVFLNQGSKKQAGKVPEGYFDDLSNKILFRIKNTDASEVAAEETNISPLLFSLKDKDVFNVPAGYFESLSGQVLNKVKPKSAKIISLHAAKNWRRYVAAAMVAALISIGTIQLFNNKDSDRSTPQFAVTDSESIPGYMKDAAQYKTPEQLNKGIASLSDDDIVNYLEYHGNIMDNYLLTKDIDTKELPDASEYLIDENTLNNFLNQIDAQASNENSE
jgi:hypothetical protein